MRQAQVGSGEIHGKVDRSPSSGLPMAEGVRADADQQLFSRVDC